VSNRISGVMVSMLTSSALDHGFKPRSVNTKDYKIGICCFSAKHMALRRKSKDWLARNQDNVSELSDMSSTKWTSSSSHWMLTCSRHDIAENCWVGVKQQSLTHSLIGRNSNILKVYTSINALMLLKCCRKWRLNI
jgi:hypothetical protein